MENMKYNNLSFREILKNTAELNRIMNHMGLKHMQFEKIISSYEKDNNRFGAIFLAKDNNRKEKQKIIIDAIDGEPNSTQVKELTYDLGADCDKRIILYTLANSNKNEFWYEQEMMEGFAKVNNDCGFETFVSYVSLNSDKTYNYDVEIYPDEKKWTSLRKLPTKLEFEKAIFKVFFEQTEECNGYDHDYINDLDHWFYGTCRYLNMYGICFMFPVWEENGLFIQADSITDEGADDLRSIKGNNNKYLRKMFVNRETSFKENCSGSVTMLIRLWDKPLSFFSKATYEDKKKIVEQLRNVAGRIDEYFNYRHYLDGSRNEDVEEYLAIPENTFNELEKEISD